jgi:hypothetical protein
MKRCIAAVALAFLAFPGGALGMQDLRGEQHDPTGSAAPLAQTQAKGTDVAAPDQQAPRSAAPASGIVADDDSGFDYGDAGIGAGIAVTLIGGSVAAGMALRRQHRLAG